MLHNQWIAVDVNIIPGYVVPPIIRPKGYHDSGSYQFQKEYAPSLVRYFVTLKLNQGSNSWIITSNLITEKIRIIKAKKHISPRVTKVILGAAFCPILWNFSNYVSTSISSSST